MATPTRWGLSLPLPGVPLGQHRDLLQAAERLGYTDAWSEDNGLADPFVMLALAAAWTERLRLGTAIANVFTHGPATLAISALSLAEAVPGRFCRASAVPRQPLCATGMGSRSTSH